MRYLLSIALLLPCSSMGCAAIALGVTIGLSQGMQETQLEAERVKPARAELEVSRINAGLTQTKFMEEMRRLDPEWYRAQGKEEIFRKAKKRGLRRLPHHKPRRSKSINCRLTFAQR